MSGYMICHIVYIFTFHLEAFCNLRWSLSYPRFRSGKLPLFINYLPSAFGWGPSIHSTPKINLIFYPLNVGGCESKRLVHKLTHRHSTALFLNSQQFFTFVTHTSTHSGPLSIFVRKAATVGKLLQSPPWTLWIAALSLWGKGKIYFLEDKLYEHFPKVNVINFRQRKQNIPQKNPKSGFDLAANLQKGLAAYVCASECVR